MVLIQSFHFPCILSNVLLETKTILKKSYESCSFDFEKNDYLHMNCLLNC